MSRPCPDCGDSREIVITGTSVNPFSGVQVPDPQKEDIVPCPRCTRPPRTNVVGGRAAVERMIASIQHDQDRSAA